MKQSTFIIIFKILHYSTNILSSVLGLLSIIMGILLMHKVNVLLEVDNILSLLNLLLGLYLGYIVGKIIDSILLLGRLCFFSYFSRKFCEPKVILQLVNRYF